eukprot:Amastigsp_a176607_61.p5 type:complete len:120 gc:universal Amastigsp_a176607_61:1818-1459(-)
MSSRARTRSAQTCLRAWARTSSGGATTGSGATSSSSNTATRSRSSGTTRCKRRRPCSSARGGRVLRRRACTAGTPRSSGRRAARISPSSPTLPLTLRGRSSSGARSAMSASAALSTRTW